MRAVVTCPLLGGCGNPAQAANPYLRLEHLNTVVEIPVEAAKEHPSELYENFNFDEVKLSEKDGDVYIQTENSQEHAKSKWTKRQRLFTRKGEVREDVKKLKGFQMASRGLLGRLEEINVRVAAERTVEELNETLDERERKYQRQNKLLLDSHGREKADLREEVRRALQERDRARKSFDLAREELGMTKVEVGRLNTTIEGALHEREELIREICAKEEQLRQREQGIEDLERQLDEQKQKLNDSARTEEERRR